MAYSKVLTRERWLKDLITAVMQGYEARKGKRQWKSHCRPGFEGAGAGKTFLKHHGSWGCGGKVVWWGSKVTGDHSCCQTSAKAGRKHGSGLRVINTHLHPFPSAWLQWLPDIGWIQLVAIESRSEQCCSRGHPWQTEIRAENTENESWKEEGGR